MSTAPPEPEAVLCAAYRDQATLYRRAATLAEPLAVARAAQAEGLGGVIALLAEAAAIEERIRPVKGLWARADGKPGDELCAVLAEVMHLIEQLTQSLAGAERQAEAHHARLVPQLDALIRGRAMRTAYGHASCPAG